MSTRTEIEVPAGESRYRVSQEGEFIFHLRHPGSSLLLTGSVQASEEAAPVLLTQVIHHAPHTQAKTLVKTLADGTAQPHYEGLIRIEKGAVGCESFLSHHSLLIGSSAKSWTRPALEILNDEVKCSHAATVRTITDFDLFYLRSRGLAREEAIQLLTEAFLAEVA